MSRPLIVLQSFPEPRATTNPYIVMLARSLAAVPGVELKTFSWRAALLDPLDVFHVHWPEILLRGPSPLKTLRRQLLFTLFLVRVFFARTAVVRTQHNLAPHDSVTRREALLLAALERLTTARIGINAAAGLPPGEIAAVIVHGHYRDWFAAYEKPAAIAGRIGSFGLLKPYKGVDRLIGAFRDAPEESTGPLSLRIAGRPASDAFADELRRAAEGDPRIRLDFAYIDDEDLVRLTSESELVAFPYRQMHNSGGVLAALSLERPVLVPENQINGQLASEVGPGWVHLFRGELTGQDLVDALSALRSSPPPAAPDLSAREWARAGLDHVALYRRALAARGRRRPGVAPIAEQRATQTDAGEGGSRG